MREQKREQMIKSSRRRLLVPLLFFSLTRSLARLQFQIKRRQTNRLDRLRIAYRLILEERTEANGVGMSNDEKIEF